MEGSEIRENCDIVSQLTESGMEHIAGNIFENMDTKSLSSAEKASVLWANVIEKEKLWEKLYKKNVLKSHDWKVIQNSLDIYMLGVLSNAEGDIIDHHEYKKGCYLIAQKLEEMKNNWKIGLVIERKCSIVPPCRAYGEGFGWFYNTYRPMNNRSFAFNSRWALTAGEDSKITVRNRFKLDKIVDKLDIPISNDSGGRPLISTVVANERFIVVCFYFNSQVCVWDVATRKLLVVLDGDLFDDTWDRLRSSLHKICLHDDSLLTMHGGGADVVCTMYKFSDGPEPVPSQSFKKMLPIKGVKDVYMDKEYISMLVCLTNPTDPDDLNFRIITRSATMFDVISDIDMKESIVAFHYMEGVIAVVKTGNSIKLIDAVTSVCIRKVANPTCYLADLKMIKHKYLVVCDHNGCLDIWDLQKMMDPNGNENDFLVCCTAVPTPPFSGPLDVCKFDGKYMEADEYQVALIGKFEKQDDYSIYLKDFIGNWEREEEDDN